ncbi:P-loop containing nucleoside triphosphate hydrolase protein [Ramicandelaber brevisporus]|nr:P-loop containing nucleoside triphosphate hydrolase protein [Ramicandelaber brevisporus]
MDIDDEFQQLNTTLKGKGKGKTSSSSATAATAAATAAADQTHQSLPWVEKYRPTELDELVSQNDIITTINRYIANDQMPHLLFYGPPGTGKSTTILAIARKLYGITDMKKMVLELNASDDRGIDVVRDQIKNFASTQMLFSKGYKLIILDEADAMTQQAQAALRRVIEKYTRNVRFCIICNYVSRIIPAVQSRCTRFRFSPLKPELMAARLDYVIEQERVNISMDGREAILKLSNGDMRRVLNILQACHAASDQSENGKAIDENSVYVCTAHPTPEDVRNVLEWMLNEEFTTAQQRISRLKTEKGYALNDIVTELLPIVMQIEFSSKVLAYILSGMADIEYKMNCGATEAIQTSALIGVFRSAVDMSF